MRLWAEVYNAAGVMQGIVNLASLKFSRRLDGAGDFEITLPASDPTAVSTMQIRRRVRIYVSQNGGRLLFSGVLLKRRLSVGASGAAITWSGIDFMDDLIRTTTLRNRQYFDDPINDITQNLLTLAAGWTAQVETGLPNTTARFDGISVLNALLTMLKRHGLHLRLALPPIENRIEVGAFGADSGIRATQAQAFTPELMASGNVVLIDRLEQTMMGDDIVNWIEAVIGSGDAVYTIKRSDRTSPYTIQTTTGPDGRLVYYIKDDASIAQYNQVQEHLSLKESLPLEFSLVGRRTLANLLYDWGATQLRRRSVPQVVYKMSVRKSTRPVKAGDKVRVSYKGAVVVNGQNVVYANIDEIFYVLRITERWDTDGQAVDWEVSNVDMMPRTAANVLAGSVKQQVQDAISVKFNASIRQTSDSGVVSNSQSLDINFTVGDTTFDVGRVTLTLTRTATFAISNVLIALDGDPIGVLFDSELDGLVQSLDFDDALSAIEPLTGPHTLSITALYGSDTLAAVVEVTEITATST